MRITGLAAVGDIADFINDYSDDSFEDREVRCKFCGERYLHWEERSGRMVLVDDEDRAHAPHCKARTASADEFKGVA